MKIIHIRSTYLKITFLYYLLKGFKIHTHYVLCREIKKGDLKLFPFPNIVKTNRMFYPLRFIDKFFIINTGNVIINDWYSYAYTVRRKLGNIDIIHAHMGQEGYYSIPLSKYLNRPLVVTFYGNDMSMQPKVKGWREKYNRLFEASKGIIVEGDFMRKKVIDLGCPADKVFVFRLAIPTDNITFNYREKYTGSFNILMCANFVEKKGFLDAIDVFNNLKNEKGLDFFCEIIGDGPLKEQILKKIKKYNLSNNVKLLGRKTIEEIYKISKKHHVFFHPSKYAKNGDSEGGAPTIISEMQALGLPIISTYHADIPNIIPITNQYLSDESNIDQMSDKFISLINDNEKWDTISKTGRDFVEINHNKYKIALDIENFYENIIVSN